MANEQNLKPAWKKGDPSPNPAGRPPGIPNARTRYKRLLELTSKKANPVTGELEEFTQLELMDMAVFVKALRGDLAAYKEIMDRTEGKAAQSMDITSDGKEIVMPIYGGLSGRPEDVVVRGHNGNSKDIPT